MGDESEENIFLNEDDGLSNEHPALPIQEEEDENESSRDSFDDLPTSLIVTNIHSEVFVNDDMKAEIEELFRQFSNNVSFYWLKSFRRLRVNYDCALSAANARIQLHQFKISNSQISCYFAQPVTPVSNTNLKLPAPVKQFLISPPSSPPAGWEQAGESEPIVNQDLLAALASLTPGEIHEVHAASESTPGILVHTAQIPEDDGSDSKLRIPQTRRPEIM